MVMLKKKCYNLKMGTVNITSLDKLGNHISVCVLTRFVNPTSFVYGSSEENEHETCMTEKMNLTFHVSELAYGDVWDNQKGCCQCIVSQGHLTPAASLSLSDPCLERAVALDCKCFPLQLFCFCSHLPCLSQQDKWQRASRNRDKKEAKLSVQLNLIEKYTENRIDQGKQFLSP